MNCSKRSKLMEFMVMLSNVSFVVLFQMHNLSGRIMSIFNRSSLQKKDPSFVQLQDKEHDNSLPGRVRHLEKNR